jgi:UDP-3-O-[3-hydroxymyristoyl] glucosamine N-acyltransferase
MVKFPGLSLDEVVRAVSGKLQRGQFTASLHELGEPLEVGSQGLAFVIAESYLKDLPQTKAAVVVVQEAFAEKARDLVPASVQAVVSSPDAYVGLAQLTEVIAKSDRFADWSTAVSASARGSDQSAVHPTAKVDPTAIVCPGAVVGEKAVVGAKSVLLPNSVVGPEAVLGSDCVIFPGVVIYPRTQIGNRVRVHANAVLGSDGFGYARGPRGSVKIWHLGRVIVGDDVEIGAGTMIDRGTMKDTVIERGAKLDNLVQIGHNGHVKAHAILCAQVGMAGNVTVGQGAILAGKVGVADKIEIGDGALIGPMTGLSKDVKAGEQIMGQQPGKPRREWWRLIVLFEKLPELYERVKRLEGKVL